MVQKGATKMISGQRPKVDKLQGDIAEITIFSVEKTKGRFHDTRQLLKMQL